MSTTVERIEADVRELLSRLNTADDEPFECSCRLAQRLGQPSTLSLFEGLATLWQAGEVEHVQGQWQPRDRGRNKNR